MDFDKIPCGCTLHKFHNGSAFLHNCRSEDAYDVNQLVKYHQFKEVPLKQRPRTVLIYRYDDDFWMHVRSESDGSWSLTGIRTSPKPEPDSYYSTYYISDKKVLVTSEDIGFFLLLKEWLDEYDAKNLQQKMEIQNAKKQMKEEYRRIKTLTNRSIRI